MKKTTIIYIVAIAFFVALAIMNIFPIYIMEVEIVPSVTQDRFFSPFSLEYMAQSKNFFTAISVVLMFATAALAGTNLLLKKSSSEIKLFSYIAAVAGLGFFIPGLAMAKGIDTPFNIIVPGMYFLAIIALALPDVLDLLKKEGNKQ